MPAARRSRTIAAAPQAVWQTVADPYHLPRWWPHVERVEAVKGDRFTEVLRNEERQGARPVRADFRVVEHEPPRRRVWEQEIEDSPFARVFTRVRVTVEVEPSDDGAVIRLALEQGLRGASKLGAPLVRRGAKRLLTQALDGLERLHAAPD